jgi:hypothetical protein
VNPGWIQKYALNLGWFLLLMGGISLLDREIWSYLGVILMLAGLLNMINSIRILYFGKSAFLFNVSSIYWINIFGLFMLTVSHIFTVKKEISWELLVFLVLIVGFLFLGKMGSQDLQKPADRKSSAN